MVRIVRPPLAAGDVQPGWGGSADPGCRSTEITTMEGEFVRASVRRQRLRQSSDTRLLGPIDRQEVDVIVSTSASPCATARRTSHFKHDTVSLDDARRHDACPCPRTIIERRKGDTKRDQRTGRMSSADAIQFTSRRMRARACRRRLLHPRMEDQALHARRNRAPPTCARVWVELFFRNGQQNRATASPWLDVKFANEWSLACRSGSSLRGLPLEEL